MVMFWPQPSRHRVALGARPVSDALAVRSGRVIALRYAAADAQHLVALRALFPLVATDAATAWAHLTVPGSYAGHPMGPFAFDETSHTAMIRNFAAQTNPVPLTYEHPRYDDGQPKPAAGWVHDLEVRDGGLWGRCEFTARAADLIRAGEYRYTSVVVALDSKDRKTGKPIGAELIEVALTNTPFVDGQTPLALAA